MLELKNITKIYNPGEITEACLFRDFNLSVEAGEFVSIVGSNGSGKTSLLNIICGSIPIQGGDVIIDGESMLHKKEFVRYRRFGRVYQNPALGTSPNLTMFENLSLADNKGKAYDLSRGANHARRESYREQLASLLYIAVSKTVLSMENIDILFKMQREHYSAGEAYDTFCNELEACLPVVFGYQKAAPLPTDVNDERMLLRSTILAAANKMYLDCCFDALRQEENLWADILPDLM